jgi:hemolysin III
LSREPSNSQSKLFNSRFHTAGMRPYKFEELTIDRWIHWAGIGLGVLGAIPIVGITLDRNGIGSSFVILVNAVCLLVMLGCLAAYHLARPTWRRELLRRFDHAAIFLMIGGTYTPFTTSGLLGSSSRAMTLAIWAIALLGVSLKVVFPRRLEGPSVILYLMLGWIGLIALRPILTSLDPGTVILLGVGGVFYSVGVGFHLWQRLKFQNALWHGFVLFAAACHYVAVLRGVVLAAA